MKEYIFQKIYFMEIHIQYPSLLYNQILLEMLGKYKIKKIFILIKILMYVKALSKKNIWKENINENMDNIKL